MYVYMGKTYSKQIIYISVYFFTAKILFIYNEHIYKYYYKQKKCNKKYVNT